jgi:hypothetical protein
MVGEQLGEMLNSPVRWIREIITVEELDQLVEELDQLLTVGQKVDAGEVKPACDSRGQGHTSSFGHYDRGALLKLCLDINERIPPMALLKLSLPSMALKILNFSI